MNPDPNPIWFGITAYSRIFFYIWFYKSCSLKPGLDLVALKGSEAVTYYISQYIAMWSSYSKWVWVSKHRRRCWLQLPQVHRTRRRCRTGIVACACRAARQFPIRRSWHNWGNVKINENHVWWRKNLNWCWYMLIQFECLHLICHGKKLNLVQSCWMHKCMSGHGRTENRPASVWDASLRPPLNKDFQHLSAGLPRWRCDLR